MCLTPAIFSGHTFCSIETISIHTTCVLLEFKFRNRPDPFSEKSIDELERICEDTETSKIFFMVGKGEAPVPSVRYPANGDDKTEEEFEALSRIFY